MPALGFSLSPKEEPPGHVSLSKHAKICTEYSYKYTAKHQCARPLFSPCINLIYSKRPQSALLGPGRYYPLTKICTADFKTASTGTRNPGTQPLQNQRIIRGTYLCSRCLAHEPGNRHGIFPLKTR